MVNSAVASIPQNDSKVSLQVVTPVSLSVMEQVIIKGDLAQLKPEERVEYYMQTCKSIGVNPLTQPFGYLELDGPNGKTLTLYAKRDCTDQLRRIYDVSATIMSRDLIEGLYLVTARASLPNGRTDESIGAVPLMKEGGEWVDVIKDGKKVEDGKWANGGIKYKRRWESDGTQTPISIDARANAIMKAETKAKRRVTLSICGLGWMDESEIDTVASARIVDVDPATGEIKSAPRAAIANNVNHSPQVEVIETTAMISAPQMRMIRALQTEKGITNEGIKTLHGKASAKDLTYAEASALIEKLQEFSDVDVETPSPAEYDERVAAGQRGMETLSGLDPDRFTN